MIPYYQDASTTIYCGDCLDVLSEWEGLRTKTFDLLLTDPPYGLGLWSATGGQSLSQTEVDAVNQWDGIDVGPAIKRALAVCRYAVIWGGNYLGHHLGRTRAPLVWDKGIRGMHFADGEMAWTNFDHGTLRILNLPIAAAETKGQRLHPTQKPEELMRWSIRQAKASATILDPFMGSGTTLMAAKRLGKTAVGIELDEGHCRTAVERLRQDVLPLHVDALAPDAIGMFEETE